MQQKDVLQYNSSHRISESVPRIGLYGGTFDPVHRGHIKLARAALHEIGLEKVLFLPATQPPHKSEQTSYNHRLAMLELAIADEEEKLDGQFAIETIEEELPRPSYTINAIEALSERYPAVSFFFIMGFDSLLDIKNWHGWQKIVSTVHLVVAQRHGYIGKESGEVDTYMAELGYISGKSGWRSNGAGKEIYLLEYIPPFISSSDIKTALHYGDEGFVAAGKMLYGDVVQYIVEHQLYH